MHLLTLTNFSAILNSDLIAAQRQWIDDHGGNLAGYVARYGSCRNEGAGETIYAADMAKLNRLERL